MDESRNSSIFSRPHLTKEQRLPKCYKEAEKVIKSVKSCQSNFKTVLANSRFRGAHHKKLYKLTLNVLKHYNYIQKIIDQTQLLKKEKFLRKEIASILIYELIFGNGNLPGESKVVTTIKAYKDDLINVHEMLQSSNTDIFSVTEINIPRYVRVHTLVTTVPYVIKDLENYGFTQIFYDEGISEERYLQLVKSLEKGTFLVDFHFKDVLAFAQREKLIDLDLYNNGHIFLQDKASYIPVHVLSPEPGCTVLDACAAPGMKSIHIASKMKNKGKLIACERDVDRFETLKETLKRGAVKISKALCTDFKLIDPNDQAYSSLEYILIDPSCSGSGMVSRMDEVTDTEDSKNKERLMKLSGFQIILLKHALKFPSVKRVVYSTCSVHEEENEYVVHEALNAFSNTFKLVPIMPKWPDRGSENFEYGKLCLRTVPEKHLTNGFFVAMFERTDNYEHRRGKHSSLNYEKCEESVRGSYSIPEETANSISKSRHSHFKNFNQNVKEQQVEDGVHRSYDIQKNKECKTSEFPKKKKKEYTTGIQFPSNELKNELQNFNSSESLEKCENSKKTKRNISPSTKVPDVMSENTAVPMEKKSKHKRYLSLQNKSEIIDMNTEMLQDLRLKQKKKKRENSVDNNLLTETQEILCNAIQNDYEVDKKKRSKKYENETTDNSSNFHESNINCHPHTNFVQDISEIFLENSEVALKVGSIQNDYSKREKTKKHKKHSKDNINYVKSAKIEVNITDDTVQNNVNNSTHTNSEVISENCYKNQESDICISYDIDHLLSQPEELEDNLFSNRKIKKKKKKHKKHYSSDVEKC